MKKNILSISLLFIMVSFFSECGPKRVDGYQIHKRAYINNSGHDIKIKYYKTTKDTILYLQKGDTLKEKETLNSIGYNTPGIYLIYADSIKIIYGNSRYQLFKPSDTSNKRNLYNIGKNLKKKEKNYISYFEYTFTEADYNNATDCKGKCE